MQDVPVAIRLNPFKGSCGPEGSPVPWNPLGRILPSRPSFTADPLFHAGCYYVQDSSAMFPGYLLRRVLEDGFAREGLRVLDLCASPGGKTTDAAASLRALLGDRFLLVSNEVTRSRVPVLLDNTARWGDPCVTVCSADPSVFGKLAPGCFDIIIADVPCSGEGMFRKDPRAREEWSPAVVDLCAARQKRILADVWPALAEGGVLIYSTCTYEDSENDSNLEWAAAELGGEILPPPGAEFASFGVRTTRCGSLLKAGEVPGEGQWAGTLIKTSLSARRPSRFDVAALRPLRTGISRGMMKGGDYIPHADEALAIGFDRSRFPEAELGPEEALRYLHRDSLYLPDAPRGIITVTYKGHPLGFVKNLGTRCNNLLPPGRRILMDI